MDSRPAEHCPGALRWQTVIDRRLMCTLICVVVRPDAVMSGGPVYANHHLLPLVPTGHCWGSPCEEGKSMGKLDQALLRDAVAYADQWVAYRQEQCELPGVVVAIRCDDQLLLSQGYGYANIEQRVPITPQHIFRIASHSKTFTATAIMQLAEHGTLRLDDRLADHIPWLRELGELAQVTIRQALNHSAGIVRDGDDADFWQLDHAFPDDQELRIMVEHGGRVLPANESFKYSNIAYGLLGKVIEAASGSSYSTYVRQHIVDPLGLADTGPEINAQMHERLATGYTMRRYGQPRQPVPHVKTNALAAATGFYSTAEDLSRYAAAHFLGDATLLTDASKREMQQPYWHATQTDAHYGLGFIIVDIGERRLVGHSGGFPGFVTRTMFDPKDRLVIVVLTNASSGAADQIGRGIVRIIDLAQRKGSAATGGPIDCRERFTGRFVNMMDSCDVAAFGNALLLLSPENDDPALLVTDLAVEDEDTLRMTTAPGFASPGETIRYIRNDAGETTRIVAGGVSAYPLPIFLQRPWPGQP
jgi:CubicO group peptidase (beta-lactamase class C family)